MLLYAKSELVNQLVDVESFGIVSATRQRAATVPGEIRAARAATVATP